ncbi:MAG: HNH endonuclease [Methylococcaceae bacterium]|nr:HNH endonuclease [Methylococcaceae bacterium]
MTISHTELKEWLRYHRRTGLFIWIKSPAHTCIKVGDIAGTWHQPGYINITLKGKLYSAHRLAWFYVYGVWPVKLDHRNTIKHHNWIKNLREATQKQNQYNVGLRRDSTSGYKGVSQHSSGRWIAKIVFNKKQRHLGCFNTPEEAAARYQLFAEKICGDFLHKSLK